MPEIIHHPKGSMCATCTRARADCSALPFASMPVHRRDGADVVVICTHFERDQSAADRRFWNIKSRQRKSPVARPIA